MPLNGIREVDNKMKGLENRLVRGVAVPALALALGACSVKGPTLRDAAHRDYNSLARQTTMDTGRILEGLADAERDGKLTYNPNGCDAAVIRGYLVGQSARDALLQLGADALLACGLKTYIDNNGKEAICSVGNAAVGGTVGITIGGPTTPSQGQSGRTLGNLPEC